MEKFNPEIFKAYDIRGIFGQDFHPDFAYHLGLAYLALLKSKKQQNNWRVVVGCDMRLSSPELHQALIKGLLAAGAEVLDIGLVSTPTFYFSISHLQADGGLIISASHNPKEWNGFKIVYEKARPASAETGIMWLRDNIGKFSPQENEGKVQKIKNILADQIKHDQQFFDANKIRPLKIAADAANSMGSPYLASLEKIMPIKLLPLNFELDGSFPAHEADPLKDENLEQLKNFLLANQADLGIATDGDGDRVFFLDETGRIISPAIIRGILAKIFLQEKPGSKICYDVRPGKITADLIAQYGGQGIITKVGHSLIKATMLEEGAYFAGESSGHFFINLDIGCFEMPIIIIGKLLEEISASGKTASQYFAPYYKYFHSGEINRLVTDKELVINKIADQFSQGKISRLDGISVEFPDFWFNVRGSNTENKLRLNLEAVDETTMISKRDEILQLMNN